MSTMLYRCPGPHEIHCGHYDYLIVNDEDIERSLNDGWFLTTPEAKQAFEAVTSDPVPADDAPPTRAELLQQAAKLGLSIDKRWGDARLLAEIEAAMKAVA